MLLKRGWWWAVGLCSVGLWSAYQVRPDLVQVPWPIADNPVFNFAPWPVLSLIGMINGYHRQLLDTLRCGDLDALDAVLDRHMAAAYAPLLNSQLLDCRSYLMKNRAAAQLSSTASGF